MISLFIQAMVDGILTGGIYACVAVGLSLSYGVMRIFNWAQGECLMGALYAAIFLVIGTSINPYLAIIVIAPLMFLAGYVIEKWLFNPLIMREKVREPLSVLLTTAGLSFFLSNLATFLFTSNSLSVSTPYTGKTLQISNIFVSVPKLIAFISVILVASAVQVFLYKTVLGRSLRATSQDRETAQLMGMNNQHLYCLALGIGFACLGIAGCLMCPIYAVSPATGNTFGFKSLVIVVLGGKGSVVGAIIGGIIIGIIESLGGALLSPLYAQIIVFAVFAAVLFFKPNGLLTKDRG